MSDSVCPGPVAIGGVGGSGTRVIARIVDRLGVFLGENLNASYDNMDFPALAQHRRHPGRAPAPYFDHDEIRAFEIRMTRAHARHPSHRLGWGWKNPPTFLYLDSFAAYFPHLRYVHVIRNGLDMAFSRNTNQLQNWGHLFDVEPGRPTPEQSALEYWIRANEHAAQQCDRLLGDRAHRINFDQMCAEPAPVVRDLCAFLGAALDDGTWGEVLDLIEPPPTIGHYRKCADAETFTQDQLARVAGWGFAVSFAPTDQVSPSREAGTDPPR